jgi:hypothetical protein
VSPAQNFVAANAAHSDSAEAGRMPQVPAQLAVHTSLHTSWPRTVPLIARSLRISKLSTVSWSRFRLIFFIRLFSVVESVVTRRALGVPVFTRSRAGSR